MQADQEDAQAQLGEENIAENHSWTPRKKKKKSATKSLQQQVGHGSKRWNYSSNKDRDIWNYSSNQDKGVPCVTAITKSRESR